MWINEGEEGEYPTRLNCCPCFPCRQLNQDKQMSERDAGRREPVCNSLEEKQKSKEKASAQSENERQKQKSEKDKSQMQLDKELSQFISEMKELIVKLDENMDRKLDKLQTITSVLD